MKLDLGVMLVYLIYARVISDKWVISELKHELVKTSKLFYFFEQQGIGVEDVVSALMAGRDEKNNIL